MSSQSISLSDEHVNAISVEIQEEEKVGGSTRIRAAGFMEGHATSTPSAWVFKATFINFRSELDQPQQTVSCPSETLHSMRYSSSLS